MTATCPSEMLYASAQLPSQPGKPSCGCGGAGGADGTGGGYCTSINVYPMLSEANPYAIASYFPPSTTGGAVPTPVCTSAI